ncbi:MAG: hypothetical protein LBV67_05330 [Streptococcaceae bacterium]|jgi:phosphate starvation-inducible membrane PsiE|nr:hypothetical protein [Streptococcaceae bacterium]
MEGLSRTRKRDLKKKYKIITIIKRFLDLVFLGVVGYLIYLLAIDFYNSTDMNFLDTRVMTSAKQLGGILIFWIVMQFIHGSLKKRMN